MSKTTPGVSETAPAVCKESLRTGQAAPVRTYAVTVQGFPEQLYCARTPARARARCWDAFRSYADVPFRQFLGMSSIRRVPNPPGVGDRILVSGVPATRVLSVGQYVGFVRDDSDTVLCSHPLDVEEIDAR